MNDEPTRSTERDITWGHSLRSSRVHLFISGKRQCISSRGQQQQAYETFPDWDMEDPDTCKKCKERYYWLQKGAVPVTRTTRTAQKA
ncbi:MAG: hypothetical protein Q8R70_04925 [Methanoregula sp.]|nr:hypothetical protein [Methanoregula sp.]